MYIEKKVKPWNLRQSTGNRETSKRRRKFDLLKVAQSVSVCVYSDSAETW